ncbi:MetQ/NlpA family ABC transporter substrate-binding protein [Pendulispora rubella]|uniref:Lipoprotein n=1 Tax=Pendulispora rubella TaxID=2741070 RepID=A0ABZ2LLN4_9BACT
MHTRSIDKSVTRRLFLSAVTALCTTLSLGACSKEENKAGAAASEGAAKASTAEAKADAPLKVGASPIPHADILRFVQEKLAEKEGLKLQIVEFTDYVQPNLALNDKQIDANFFQHVPYMEEFGKQRGIAMVSVAKVHIEPLGLYSKKVKALGDAPKGSIIAIPNDPTNAGRALHLLADNGLLTLKDGVPVNATVQDIATNPKGFKIKELEAAQLPRSLDDTSLSIVNGNYAIQVGLKPAKDALALEKGEGNPYANVLSVLKGQENEPRVQKLAKLLTSPEVKEFINKKYDGAVLAAF